MKQQQARFQTKTRKTFLGFRPKFWNESRKSEDREVGDGVDHADVEVNRHVEQTNGQSYKRFTSINYDPSL